MRVGIVVRLTEPGGVQSVALSLARGLNARGIVPDILWDLPPSEPLVKSWGVRLGFHPVKFPVPTPRIDRMRLSLRYLAYMINAVDGERFRGVYDFVYTVNQVFVFPPDFPHLYYLSGPPLLPQLENPPPGIRGVPLAMFKLLYRAAWRHYRPIYDYQPGSDFVINSHYTARLFSEAHGITLPVVHPPIDLSGRSFDPADLPRRDSLVFFSRIVAYKRPGMVMDLAARHRELRCVIMGGVQPHRRSYYEDLRRSADASGLRIEFLDNPSDQRVREELARARFYVFPAVNEHFGMTTPEAIASGAIPFVHDSGGQPEIVNDERLRFTDGEFHEKFARLVRMPEAELRAVRERLVAHMNDFSEEAFLAKMLPYLDRVPGTAAAKGAGNLVSEGEHNGR
ncbi:MAG TPA: glycosyltransferase family 4 protein [Bacteroidota bacterium]|nr:glycosyltransferase family 4 protein [Bacteroidota bacterium]